MLCVSGLTTTGMVLTVSARLLDGDRLTSRLVLQAAVVGVLSLGFLAMCSYELLRRHRR